MAKYYIKQKVFSFRDRFNIYNEYGESVFTVYGEIISLGKKLHMLNINDNEVAYIHQKLLSFLPKFFINRNDEDIATVTKKLTFLKDRYIIEAFGWEVKGDIVDHNYSITGVNGTVAVISKKWLSWGDSYEIAIADGIDNINVLCTVLVIDAVKAAEAAAASAN